MTLPEVGAWEICEVCNWEDDPVQREDPNLAGGANEPSLKQARSFWRLTARPLPANKTAEMKTALALVANAEVEQ
jgi:hypothetical protein